MHHWIETFFGYLKDTNSIYSSSDGDPQIFCATNYDVRISEVFQDEPDNNLFELSHVDNIGFPEEQLNLCLLKKLKNINY